MSTITSAGRSPNLTGRPAGPLVLRLLLGRDHVVPDRHISVHLLQPESSQHDARPPARPRPDSSRPGRRRGARRGRRGGRALPRRRDLVLLDGDDRTADARTAARISAARGGSAMLMPPASDAPALRRIDLVPAGRERVRQRRRRRQACTASSFGTASISPGRAAARIPVRARGGAFPPRRVRQPRAGAGRAARQARRRPSASPRGRTATRRGLRRRRRASRRSGPPRPRLLRARPRPPPPAPRSGGPGRPWATTTRGARRPSAALPRRRSTPRATRRVARRVGDRGAHPGLDRAGGETAAPRPERPRREEVVELEDEAADAEDRRHGLAERDPVAGRDRGGAGVAPDPVGAVSAVRRDGSGERPAARTVELGAPERVGAAAEPARPCALDGCGSVPLQRRARCSHVALVVCIPLNACG
jgi:hypothetical protein